jgi:hypothetical protein
MDSLGDAAQFLSNILTVARLRAIEDESRSVMALAGDILDALCHDGLWDVHIYIYIYIYR